MQFAQRVLSTRGGTIAVSVMAAALAAVILIAYLHRYRESVKDAGVPVTILVSKSLIEKGTSGDVIASQDLYQVSTTPRGDVAEGAITDPATLKGRVATADIYPGEQLTAGKLGTSTTTSLANRITGDQRVMTIPVDAAHGLIGELEAGDHVDIYGGFNVKRLRPDGTADPGATERPVLRLLVSDVLVVSIPESNSRGIGSTAKSELTIRASDDDAAKLAFAADNGTVWAVLRPRANAAATNPNLVSIETVLFGVPSVAVVRSLGGRR